MAEKKDRKFEILKKEFLKSVKYFSDLEEKYQIKSDTIMMSFDNHYTNLINYLLEKQSIKKYLEKINIDTTYNVAKKDKVSLYGVCSANIRIDEDAMKDRVISKMINRIIGKLAKKEIERQFGYIVSMYQFYMKVLKEFNLNKYYYYYYYKNNLLAKHKELSEQEILELLDKLFGNSEKFNDYFSSVANKVHYKIVDFLDLTGIYIEFLKDFRKTKYIGRDGTEKEKTEIQLIGFKGNYINDIPLLEGPQKEEREKVLKRNYELSLPKGQKIDSITIKNYYLKKIKVEEQNGKKVANLDDFYKAVKRSIKNLIFMENVNQEFLYRNLYKLLLYYRKKKKGKAKEVNTYTDVLDTNSIKLYVLEKHKKNLNYVFNIKDFILVNDNLLKNVLDVYLDTDKKLSNSFEKYILENITKIAISSGKDIDKLLEEIDMEKDYWFNEDFNILSINKQIKKNIFKYLRSIVDIKDYKLNYNISIYL